MSKFFKSPLTFAISGAIFVAVVIVLGMLGTEHKMPISGKLQIVADENFWGSLAAQIGGDKVQVASIVSDPNADPHEYETTTANARAVADANYVILNGAGYDAWGDKLLTASPNTNRKVLHVADLLGKKNTDNPHFWYSPSFVDKTTAQIEKDLAQLDPSNASYFAAQYSQLQAKLAGYQNRIAGIKQQFGGTQVAATEDIFDYLAQATGLDLVSPPAFIQAVAEGNDPPTSSLIQFQQQLQSGQVKVLVYNQQTTTPLTDAMKKLAAAQGIPTIGITEIVQPANLS
ncbi:MAG TPA: zinc ABC transporter substrate-binding protein, partial [Candidatus Acidoferrum sp.]|nr:zinc ABC transporter substrate-binding protein [Candidatus Acidoferrum sp.]